MSFEQQEEVTSKVEDVKTTVREALGYLLTTKKDLDSLVRYMFVRPVRTLANGGLDARDKNDEAAMAVVKGFCQENEIEYPKTVKEVEELIERLNSSEFDQKIGDMQTE
jgi:hypothetical protein